MCFHYFSKFQMDLIFSEISDGVLLFFEVCDGVSLFFEVCDGVSLFFEDSDDHSIRLFKARTQLVKDDGRF